MIDTPYFLKIYCWCILSILFFFKKKTYKASFSLFHVSVLYATRFNILKTKVTVIKKSYNSKFKGTWDKKRKAWRFIKTESKWLWSQKDLFIKQTFQWSKKTSAIIRTASPAIIDKSRNLTNGTFGYRPHTQRITVWLDPGQTGTGRKGNKGKKSQSELHSSALMRGKKRKRRGKRLFIV